MSVKLTSHARSNKILNNLISQNINLEFNKVSFNLCFNSEAEISQTNNWYLPTKKKFLYTLFKNNLDTLWGMMQEQIEENYNHTDFLSDNIYSILSDSQSDWKILIEKIDITNYKDNHILLSASMYLILDKDENTEIYPLEINKIDRELLTCIKDRIPVMLLDTSSYGIKI